MMPRMRGDECRLFGQTGHAFLHRICLLLTQSGHQRLAVIVCFGSMSWTATCAASPASTPH